MPPAEGRLDSSYTQSTLHTILQTSMRYYEQKYPEVDELVMVQVRQIAEMGAYVKLVSILRKFHG